MGSDGHGVLDVKPEICKMCGSPAVMYLKTNPKGRHCDNCGAGWYVIPRPTEETTPFEELKAKVSEAAKQAKEWARKRLEEIRDQDPNR